MYLRAKYSGFFQDAGIGEGIDFIHIRGRNNQHHARVRDRLKRITLNDASWTEGTGYFFVTSFSKL